jgi:hypothetical protein
MVACATVRAMRAPGGRAAATVVVLAAMMMAGCSTGGSGDAARYVVAPAQDTGTVAPIEEALAILPREVALIDFSGDRLSADRLGLFDEDASSYADLGTTFADRRADVPADDVAATSSLAGDVAMMTEGGAAFSQLDVRWSMRATTGTGPTDDGTTFVEVFRLVDGVEMDDVVADLEDAGFDRSSDDGWEVLRLEGQLSDHVDVEEGLAIGGRYPDAFFPEVRVHPDAHLVALGDVSVLDPGSTTDPTGLATALQADGLEDLERVGMTAAGFVRCSRPVDLSTDNRATPERIVAWQEKFDTTALGVPVVTVLSWAPGGDVVHRAFFTDENAAARAFTARKRIYAGAGERTADALGVLMPAQGNESPYDPGWTIETRANYIEVRHNQDRPGPAVQTYFERGLGFDACGAPGLLW